MSGPTIMQPAHRFVRGNIDAKVAPVGVHSGCVDPMQVACLRLEASCLQHGGSCRDPGTLTRRLQAKRRPCARLPQDPMPQKT